MSDLAKASLVTGMVLTLAAPAWAQGANPWQLEERNAYAVDMQGNMRIYQPNETAMGRMRRGAKRVPRGTIFFMNGGQLYMMQGNDSVFKNF
jgi:ABC-type uncharacterized transport system YnjBCD substrate-binding protein